MSCSCSFCGGFSWTNHWLSTQHLATILSDIQRLKKILTNDREHIQLRQRHLYSLSLPFVLSRGQSTAGYEEQRRDSLRDVSHAEDSVTNDTHHSQSRSQWHLSAIVLWYYDNDRLERVLFSSDALLWCVVVCNSPEGRSWLAFPVSSNL